ncbi:AbrB/MazE/SpoVT family DNA-binding domain-containing protein [archaeon]|nr:MAG: AbrB/MazE/SpoVT family DNA-binding domain-containing protein [archaeon]
MEIFIASEAIVIPPYMLEEMGISPDDRIIMTASKGKVIIERYESRRLAEMLAKELRGVERDRIVRDTEEKVYERLWEEYPFLRD